MDVALALHAAARSHTGPRPDNQDSGLVSPALVAVADGVGGNVGGAVASGLVVSWLAPLGAGLLADEPDGGMARLVSAANERIRTAVTHRPRLEGMATTLCAVGVQGDSAVLAHIGDSRAYRWRAPELVQLTRDHTLVQALMDAGSITAEEALVHPQRSAVYAALHGGTDDVEGLEVLAVDVRPGDRLLVCSDGLSGALPAQVIAELLAVAENADQAAATLLGAALAAPASDNVTVVVADVLDDMVDGRPATRYRTVGAASGARDETVEVLEALWPGPATGAFRPVAASSD
ncbi:PP2C family protein-serine/threonine phosphatase [Klenkia brasiliensis]|uniref:Serine/threonine protein phosphatase PrpC n=1 Tax=Klenkia brasiliensis TaxID=333142 RepID=A0A1G7PYT7_9ACTN|nr:protein phosphatase 2C domain-containing protein [Klenkia brasiliensis]SDF90530.1 Serine/threonine protein phosphatase PrpC [Klenkia brasiliensis]